MNTYKEHTIGVAKPCLGGNMKQHEQKMWLLIDSIVKKLKRAQQWCTSADEYDKEVKTALFLLEQALKKIEGKHED